MSATTTSSPPEIRQKLRDVVAAADGRKATDLKVLKLEEVSDFTDFFMVCSGRTARQVGAIAEAIRRALREGGVHPLHIEGERSARWILLDYGDLVIHVFDPEMRGYYQLERLWADAPDVTAELRGVSGSAAFDGFLSAAPSLRPLLQQAQRAARSDAPVLILGPAGSGRSSLARALHAGSDRQAEALVEVDVAAIPATLFESEFFGFAAGAFTSAERSSPGRVARAEGGTLVLDHLEELPLASQPKLLRLLSERRYTPLGGADRRADVRFVGVGVDDLEERVRRESFRADLFYRLEVLTFTLPALEQRKTDLPAIFDHFLADLAERSGRRHVRLTDRALRWMLDYRWPGNLRQVRNVLERALIEAPAERPLDPEAPADREARPESLAAVERRQIETVLAYTRGHQGRAADVLGISRKTLWEKRRKYGIP